MKAPLAITFAAAALAALTTAGCQDPEKRVEFTDLLAKIIPKSAKSRSMELFDPDDPDKRRKAVEDISAKPWGLKEPYLEAYATLVEKDEEPSVRSAAVRALGRAREKKYLPVIVAALSDEAKGVRWDAACALDNLPGRKAVDPLRERVVSDESVDVRVSSVRALRHYNEPRVIATLVRALSDPNFTVRNRAHDVLVEIKGVDHGFAAGKWLKGIKDLPTTTKVAAPPPQERSWWEKLTKRSPRKKRAPKPRAPANLKPPRPWWDWFGVTDAPDKPPVKQAPKNGKKAEKAENAEKRPWWDWMGVTVKKDEPRKKPAEKRSFWQWLGVKGEKGE